MFCNKCGKDNNDGSKFCAHCGAILSVTPAAVENTTTSVKDEKMSVGNIILIVVIALIVVKCAVDNSGSSSKASKVESNPNHVSSDISVTQTQADALKKLIRAYGYSCNSLSSALQSSYDGSYSVTCNNWQYRYDIEDVGGNWVVTVN